MSAKDKARERASKFFSNNSSVLKHLAESESDVGYFSAKILQELETDFADALLAFRKETLDAAITAVEDAGGDNTEYHSAAIRRLEE